MRCFATRAVAMYRDLLFTAARNAVVIAREATIFVWKLCSRCSP